MDFAVKIVVLFMLVVDVFGRSIPPKDSNATEEDGSCELNGIFYPLNSIFNAPINPCFVCECNENWTGAITNTSCYKEECDEIVDKPQEGCIAVYDETKCCVIDFYCRDSIIPDSTEDSEIENDNATEGNDEVVCPTPICADESCRIEVPPGQLCPTCICEGFKEKNDFESAEQQLPERAPLEAQNATEDMEFFLIPVPWSGIADGVENSFEESSNDEGSLERVEVSNPEALEQGNENGMLREDSIFNTLPGATTSKRTEPRRKRSALLSAQQQRPQQQQQWTVLQEDDQISESDERERENSEDDNEDYGGMKIMGREDSETADNTNNEITDLYDEESIVWDRIVPGCPTPICEHSGCRIGIPPNQKCPTCICNRRLRQP